MWLQQRGQGSEEKQDAVLWESCIVEIEVWDREMTTGSGKIKTRSWNVSLSQEGPLTSFVLEFDLGFTLYWN